jgi:DNA-binding NtrC family response regulator
MSEHARILIVDDDESIRNVLATILEDRGYIVDSAGTGKEGIEKTNMHFYNLTFVDVRLPDMTGPEVLGKMRDTVPKMRKIIITGYPSLQNAVEALNNGAHAYIMKPFDMDKVLKIMDEQLKLQKEETTFSQEKVTEFVKSRVKELEANIAP